jgi:hypothetical protein
MRRGTVEPCFSIAVAWIVIVSDFDLEFWLEEEIL